MCVVGELDSVFVLFLCLLIVFVVFVFVFGFCFFVVGIGWSVLFWGGLVFSGHVLFLFGEFDPGSGRTLAACLTHASRTDAHGFGCGC